MQPAEDKFNSVITASKEYQLENTASNNNQMLHKVYKFNSLQGLRYSELENDLHYILRIILRCSPPTVESKTNIS